MREGVDIPSIVRPAEDLTTLARLVREDERKGKKNQLELVKRQALRVLAARQQCTKRGSWGQWREDAELSQPMAWKYAEFGKHSCMNGFSDLTDDQQWAQWLRITGNYKPQAEEEEEEEEATQEDQDSESGSEEETEEQNEQEEEEEDAEQDEEESEEEDQDDNEEPDPDSQGKGMTAAHKAIGVLRHLSHKDPYRRKAFEAVRDWVVKEIKEMK